MGDNAETTEGGNSNDMGLPPFTWKVETVTGPMGTKVRVTIATLYGELKFVMDGELAVEWGTALSAAGGDASRGLIIAAPTLLGARPIF